MLPHGIEANLRALRSRAPHSEALVKFETVARLLTGRNDACAEDGVEWVHALCARFRIPSLRAYGMSDGDVGTVVEKAAKASSMKANPIVLTEGELLTIAKAAL